MTKNKIAIFFFEGYVSVSPTIINLCSFLNEHNHEVVLFTRRVNEKFAHNYDKFPFRIQFIDFDFHYLYSILLIVFNRIFKKKYRKVYNFLIYVMNSYLFIRGSLKQNTLMNDFDQYIGVDPIGLIAANNFNSNKKKLIYLSLEINYLFNNNNIYTRWVKRKEQKIHPSCFFTIIQDVNRMKYLCNENLIDFKAIKYFLLPNSPRPNSINFSRSRSNYFIDKFLINDNHFIVLSAGMISDEVHSFDIVNSIKDIRDNVVLVLHERRFVDINSDLYIKSLLDLNSDNLYLSLDPVEYDKIDLVFASADIGLALYNIEYGVNYSNILFASGKISQYLKNGKPIIVNDLPGMREFVSSTDCGIVIEGFRDLATAILTIKNNYLFYSINAEKAYHDYFNFDKYCSAIFSSMSK